MKKIVLICLVLIAAIAGIFITLRAIIGDNDSGYGSARLVSAQSETAENE